MRLAQDSKQSVHRKLPRPGSHHQHLYRRYQLPANLHHAAGQGQEGNLEPDHNPPPNKDDLELRHLTYRLFVELGHAPTAEKVAQRLPSTLFDVWGRLAPAARRPRARAQPGQRGNSKCLTHNGWLTLSNSGGSTFPGVVRCAALSGRYTSTPEHAIGSGAATVAQCRCYTRASVLRRRSAGDVGVSNSGSVWDMALRRLERLLLAPFVYLAAYLAEHALRGSLSRPKSGAGQPSDASGADQVHG